MPAPTAAYDEDYYAWALTQAEALRRLAAERWNGPLDLENLAEEVADLGKAARNSVFSQIEHLLKLQFSSRTKPCRQCIITIDDARRELEKHLTPTLRRELEEGLSDLCPYTLAQLIDEDWLPPSAA
jgi:hypothetical protein